MENGENLIFIIDNIEVISKVFICIFVLIVLLIENIMVFVIFKKNFGCGVSFVNGLFIVNMLVVDVFFVL